MAQYNMRQVTATFLIPDFDPYDKVNKGLEPENVIKKLKHAIDEYITPVDLNVEIKSVETND